MTTIYIKNKESLPERRDHDFYATEVTLIRAALDTFGPNTAFNILDMGAGDGRWGREAKNICGIDTTWVTGVEIRDTSMPVPYNKWVVGDILEPEVQRTLFSPPCTPKYDLIVSNPPYKYAEKFIRLGWDLLKRPGKMIMLLPLQFQAGVSRFNGLWNEIWPYHVAVCSRRPSFYGGGTNGTDYGIYAWEKVGLVDGGFPKGAPRSWQTSLLNYERDKTNQ